MMPYKLVPAFNFLISNLYYQIMDVPFISKVFLFLCILMLFSVLTLLVECQKEHPACKKLSVDVPDCRHGYLSGARCKWFAYSPAGATAIPSSPALLKSRLV